MKRIWLICCLLLVTATLVLAEPSVEGKWRSQTGNLFTVVAAPEEGSHDLELFIETTKGRKLLGRGDWSKNAAGRHFTYTIEGIQGQATCAYDPRDPNKLQVTGPNGATYEWKRVKR